MRISYVTIIVWLLLSGGNDARSEDAKTGIDTDKIAWGAAVNGLQLGISPRLKLSKTFEFEEFEAPVYKHNTLHVTVHLRNASTSDVRLLPSVWDCLAMGDDGAIPVSKIVLTPKAGGDSFTVTYQGWNHLRLLDKRRTGSESWQETLCKSVPGDKDLQLDAEEASDRQINLAAGDAVWPEWVKVSLEKDSSSFWQLTDKSSKLAPGKYRVTAVLIVDQEESQWKGKLTSGTLDVEILGQVRESTR